MTELWRKYFGMIAGCLLTQGLLIPLCYAGDNNLSGNVEVKVTVLAPPCNISDEDRVGISANFGSVSSRHFYNNSEPEVPFALHLTDCDNQVAKAIRFTFTGTEDPVLPGMLALTAGSEAKGFAVGIKSDTGALLKINQESDALDLVDGNMVFNFIAWLQATPEALANQTVGTGDFSAQAVLNLNYE